jgi:HKD family nuclease
MTRKAELILQGLTPSSHVDAVRRLFDLSDIRNVLLGVAFINESGVRQIEAQLLANTASVTVFAGIRNDATSYQGLVRLHDAVNTLYTVDTSARTFIFHPKLFLVRGKERARLLVGSANLTFAGLNRNIEAGMLLDFDLTDEDDRVLIDEIEMQFDAAVRDYPDNIVKVGSLADLDELLAARRLIDEVDIALHDSLIRDGTISGRDDEDEYDLVVPRMKLKVKSLQNEIFKAKITSSTINDHKASDAEAIAISATPVPPPPVAPSGSESIPRDTSNFAFRRKKPYRYSTEGPKKRAARLRREAKARGETTYNTGQPCRFNHYADRFVCNGKCRECNRQDSAKANRLGLYR